MEQKHYNLFLDDARQPKDVKWLELPPVAWVVVKSYKEFVETIQRDGVPACVSFDHDLADEHYQEYAIAHDPKMISRGTIRYDKLKEKTGYECAKYLAELCVYKKLPMPTFYIHTMNPIGAANIFSIMESARLTLLEDSEDVAKA